MYLQLSSFNDNMYIIGRWCKKMSCPSGTFLIGQVSSGIYCSSNWCAFIDPFHGQKQEDIYDRCQRPDGSYTDYYNHTDLFGCC